MGLQTIMSPFVEDEMDPVIMKVLYELGFFYFLLDTNINVRV